MFNFDCVKCGGAFIAIPITLTGEVHARLCAACTNEWRDVCELLPEYEAVANLDIRIQSITVAATGVADPYERVKPLYTQRQELLRGPLRKAAEEWLAVKVTRDEPKAAQKR